MSSRISPHHSQRINSYRSINRTDGSRPADEARPTQLPETTESASTAESVERPDLGDDLSREERNMIHEQFPPSPETTMRIYGRDRGGRQIRPESLGNRIDLQG